MDEPLIQLCKQLDQWSSSCVADDDFSAWISAIQKSSILQPASEDAWIEDEAYIRVRMWSQDLESQVVVSESEHDLRPMLMESSFHYQYH